MKQASMLCGLLLGLAGTWATAAETHLRREALPPAVNAAFASRYPGATILAITRETTWGVTLFEAEMNVAGRRVDVVFDRLGTLREEEESLSFAQLPESVRATHARSAQAKWTIERVELVTSAGPWKRYHYELLAFDGKQRLALAYGTDGRRMSLRKTDAED